MNPQIALSSAALAFLAALLQAVTLDFESNLSPVGASSASEWEFELVVYAPLMGVDGKTGIGTPIGPRVADLNISFSDVFDNLDGAFSGAFLAKYDRWSITGDLIWLKLSDSGDIKNVLDRGLKMEQSMGSLTIGYEVYRNNSTSIELLAGAAVTSLDVELDVELSIPPAPSIRRSVSDSETWGIFGELRKKAEQAVADAPLEGCIAVVG